MANKFNPKYCCACGKKLNRIELGNGEWALRCKRKKCGLYFPEFKFINVSGGKDDNS